MPINTFRWRIDHRPQQSCWRHVKFIVGLPVIYLTRRSTVLKSKNKQTNQPTSSWGCQTNWSRRWRQRDLIQHSDTVGMVESLVWAHSSHLWLYVSKSAGAWEHYLPSFDAYLFDLHWNSKEQIQSKLGVLQSLLINVVGWHFQVSEFNLGGSLINFLDDFGQSLPWWCAHQQEPILQLRVRNCTNVF